MCFFFCFKLLWASYPRNISVNLFSNQATDLRGDVVIRFSIFSSGSYLVQKSEKILAILVEGHSRNILKSGKWPRRRCCLKVFSA